MQRIRECLAKNTNKESVEYFVKCVEALPNIWLRPTSSTGKYHKRADGSIPTIAEHTLEMVTAGAKVVRLMAPPNSVLSDTILVALALHDGLKYGEDGMRKHTNNAHDQAMANWVSIGPDIPETIHKDVLIECIAYHSGQWSTDAKKISRPASEFFELRHPAILFVHMMDMLSTASVLNHE